MITHMPLNSVLSNPNSEPGRSSSILSRFSSPLSKRARNVFEFSIEANEPYRTYSPGDIIQGHVVLSVLRGFDITHLSIALHGYAKVYKHQSDRRPTLVELVNGQGTRGFEYLGSGLASLFQDEQVLCGSGFLKKQIYKFGFELQFPAKSLPSTVDFERGTVGYMISATVTRPTTISPTSTKFIRIQFRDKIDIESFYSPKTRMISLEPINRRGKVKKVKTNSSLSTLDASASSRRGLSRNNTGSNDHGRPTAPSSNPPLSPAPSEDTIATANTVSTGSMQVVEHESPIRKSSPQTSETRSSVTSSSAHTITATVEIPRHGAIPGDIVPIRISVSHTKPSVRGVIIATLYRTVRVDMHPIIPLSNKGKDKKNEYEDVYPKSRTGLGGLYFANSSPSSVFRKDLYQSSTMMIINPMTLTAEVNTTVKVPVEDALPTMTNLPGGMISFTYHIEVVIDLTGKLGESRFLPSLTNNGPMFTAGQESGNQLTSEWAHNILDTTPLRRTKSVVTSVLPLTVGTKDSRREQRQMDMKATQYQNYEFYGNNEWEGDMYDPGNHDPNAYWDDGFYYDEFGNPIYNEWYGYDENYQGGGPLPYVPPPEQEEAVDEKTRLRRQEESLMPSQPPEEGEASNAAQTFVPSAPSFADGSDTLDTPIPAQTPRPTVPTSMSRASARSGETVIPDTITPPPSLPDDEHAFPANEDKQELERRRLMAQASAPPSADDAGQGSSHIPPPSHAASAPRIDEDEEYIVQALRNERLGSESLPRYQR